MKLDHLTYYVAFSGPERPENLVPAMHGYSADVATLPAGQRNLLEQQVELLKVVGKFRHVSGTEIGSGNPFGDVDNLSERARFDDVPVPPATPAKMSLSASHNNQQQGEDNLQQVLDPNAYTRWSSRQSQQPGMWVQIDLGEARAVSQVRLGNDPSPRDYPRGYIIKLSLDRQSWTTVAENPLNDRPLNVTFPPRQARYIKIDQTGRDAIFWWSIYEIGITSEIKMSASASHNNVLVGTDNVAQAVDGRPETRWSSRAIQQPGMWFEVDLNQTRTVRGLLLDSARSPTDYPGGYVVRVSTDRAHWEEVACQTQNSRPLDITFNPRPARYLRVEQTGSSDRWWWSIHGVMIKE
jgi:endo-1,3(4)-beta-glucanase